MLFVLSVRPFIKSFSVSKCLDILLCCRLITVATNVLFTQQRYNIRKCEVYNVRKLILFYYRKVT